MKNLAFLGLIAFTCVSGFVLAGGTSIRDRQAVCLWDFNEDVQTRVSGYEANVMNEHEFDVCLYAADVIYRECLTRNNTHQ